MSKYEYIEAASRLPKMPRGWYTTESYRFYNTGTGIDIAKKIGKQKFILYFVDNNEVDKDKMKAEYKKRSSKLYKVMYGL